MTRPDVDAPASAWIAYVGWLEGEVQNVNARLKSVTFERDELKTNLDNAIAGQAAIFDEGWNGRDQLSSEHIAVDNPYRVADPEHTS